MSSVEWVAGMNNHLGPPDDLGKHLDLFRPVRSKKQKNGSAVVQAIVIVDGPVVCWCRKLNVVARVFSELPERKARIWFQLEGGTICSQ